MMYLEEILVRNLGLFSGMISMLTVPFGESLVVDKFISQIFIFMPKSETNYYMKVIFSLWIFACVIMF